MENFHHNYQQNKKCCKGLKGLVFGIIVVAFGVVLLLRNMNMIDPFIAKVLISWPMAIVAFGFIHLFGKEFPFGFLVMVAGGLLVASKFFGLPLNFEQIIWPALIILFGLMIIIGSRILFKGGFRRSNVIDDSFIEEVNVFSGGEHQITSDNFKGGKFVCVFGGSKINLLQSTIAKEGAQIELVAAFGGLNVVVPSDWTIKTEVVSIFGGFADKRILSAVSPDKQLTVKGVCIFGGGEIKSVPD